MNEVSKWAVWRQDDNGNRFLVQKDLDRIAAEKMVRELESRGHKQHYWVTSQENGHQDGQSSDR